MTNQTERDGDPLAEYRDTWTCPRCGSLHYRGDGDATDQHCTCLDELYDYADE